MRRALMISLLCVSLTLLLGGTAMAFHDGGVAYCKGCHTMHNSQNGQPVDPNSPNGNDFLLKDATPSDVCLSCHSQTSPTSNSGRNVLSLNPLQPKTERGAGDFVFLTEDNLNDGHSGNLQANWIPGYKAGHSIVAPSKNLAADPTVTMGPGGTFPASAMGCSSCHNPHGNGNFRLLNSTGEVQAGLYTFTNPAPNVVGLSLSGTVGESNNNHDAYVGGMSEWCSNCHADFHNSLHNLHPSGSTINGEEAQHYNYYNGTGQPLGNPATAYLAMVPFEDPGMTTTNTTGPSSSSKLMCLSCHRAHATSAPQAGRWDFNITTWAEEGVLSGSYAIPNPYASTSGNEQRSMCNKCHAKDAE